MDQNNRNNRNDKNRSRGGGMWSIVLWALLLTIGVNYLSVMLDQARSAESSCEIAYSELIDLVEEGKVKSIEFGDSVFTITPVDGFTYTDADGKSYDQDYTLFTTIIPDATENLLALCDEHGVTYTKPYQAPISPILAFMVTYILPTVLMVGAFMLLMNFITKKSGGMGGIGGIGNVGKANAKVYMEKSTGVTFADVAGQDEAKESLVEIIDFLHNPEKYTAIGAKIPKGALLVGSPGTGKTLLAKAVAGEAKVPFFSISGSDFVEMFVGVGASRVRDLFDQAKRAAPSIIFIDEIDAVGRHRGAGLGGGHDEREQTLNQLLVEMDGFAINEGVIVMAATNRRDILDPALLRPGRFDRTILVNYPDMAGRVAILQVHAKGKPLADDVDLENIAKRVPFSTGAELENIMNEAAILAARGRLKAINQQTLVEAISRVQMGPEKRSHKVTQRDKRMVAIHEAGHAIVGHVLPNCDEVHLITIVPRGQAGGYTLSLPTEEDDLQTYSQLMDFVAMGLGGHAAEQLYLGEFTTGATSDLKKATEVCRRMVTQFGMSEKLGPVYLDGDQEVFVGMEFGQSRGYSEEMAARIDAEVKRLLEECYQKAVDALSANRDRMEKLVDALLKYDTISRREFVTLMETGALPDIQDADTRTTGDVMMQDMADEKKEENSEKSAETPEKSAETPDKTADAPENHPTDPHEA